MSIKLLIAILKKQFREKELELKEKMSLIHVLHSQNYVYSTMIAEDPDLVSMSGDEEYLDGLRQTSINRMYGCVESPMGMEYAHNQAFNMELLEELCVKSDLRDYPSFLNYYIRLNNRIRDEYLFVESENLVRKFYNSSSRSHINANAEDARNYLAEILASPDHYDTERKYRQLAIIYRYFIRELNRRSALDSLYF